MHSLTRSLSLLVILFALVACTGRPRPVASPDAPAPTITYLDELSPALKMNVKRAAHTATQLSDGKVLIAGGFREEGTSEVSIASAEIYDPETNTFTPTGDMQAARSGHTATLLPDGQVLLVGGWEPGRRTATAELFDPQTGRFSYTASLAVPRAGMTATRLKDGRVLIAGGESARNTPQLIAEIYDPATHTLSPTGRLSNGRSAHTATLLNDGRALLAGGNMGDDVLASAEIYNPATETFTLTGRLNAVRYKHAAVLLRSGNVLVMGGSNEADWNGKYTSAEIYDAQAGVFTRTADLNSERFKLAEAAVLLDNGNVLVGGGNRQLEIFDAASQRFNLSQQLDTDYYFAVLTRLQDGRVLITGGYDSRIQPTDRAWIYN